ncbi:MAG: hypothetical protein CSA29_05940, partial [Desulfobacterales bacterium]
MDWKQEYAKKLVTADEAAKVVKSGNWIEYAFGVSGSDAFDKALAKRKDELEDVKIRCDIGAYPHYSMEASNEIFTWNSWHVAGHDKTWINKGLYYTPMKFHELPMMTAKDCVPNNVFVVQVSAMDKHGYFSWGVGAPSAMAAFENAQIRILEVNPKMPRVLGGGQECIHISQVDYVIDVDNDLPTIPDNPTNETDTKMIYSDTAKSGLEQIGSHSVDAIIVSEQLSDSSGKGFIESVTQVNPFIASALVSGLDKDDFHEATEGLGVLMQLPENPGAEDAKQFLEKLREIERIMS